MRLESGVVVRRAIVSKEVDPITGKFAELFHWDAREDRILPDPACGVVEKSVGYKGLEHLWGWDKAKLKGKLNERTDLLKELVNRRRLSMAQMAPELRAFSMREIIIVLKASRK